MAVSLFRRWRSQKFSDLVGQESVVSTLKNVLKSKSTARAYLFCGPRGTGKTSSARIFAKALNCERGPVEEPCGTCSQCLSIAEGSNLDVFEIDAASNTQVDKIRDFIIEKVHFTPIAARFKVYIIDEVHKLSASSFNALLKTLEEPPSHVVFILATTHPHEIPDTILSRCQRYDFRPLTVEETKAHLLKIAKIENIELDEDAARQLARAADGSLRDALVLFEQAVVFSEGKVKLDKVLDLLGEVRYDVLEEMFTDLFEARTAAALRRLDEWVRRGRDLKRLAESFQNHLRMMLLLKLGTEDETIRCLSSEERSSLVKLVQLLSVQAISSWLRLVMELLVAIQQGHSARLKWEMLIVLCAQPEVDPSLNSLSLRLDRLESSRPSSLTLDTSLSSNFDIEARLEALERKEDFSSLRETIDGLIKEVDVLKSGLKDGESVAREPEESLEAGALKSDYPIAKIDSESLERDEVDDWFLMPSLLINAQDYRTRPLEEGSEQEVAAINPKLKEPEEMKAQELPLEKSKVGLKDFWSRLMQLVKNKDTRLYGVLADARLGALEESYFEIALPEGLKWHLDRVEASRPLLESLARELRGCDDLTMRCSLGSKAAIAPRETEHDDFVAQAGGFFGGSSILE